MTKDELTQFQALAKKFEPKDKDEVLKVVKDDLHPVFQDINDGGRAAANASNKPELEKAQKEAKDAKEKAEKAEADLKALGDKAPDVTALRTKYDADLKAEREKFDRELQAKDAELIRERLQGAKDKLVRKLVADHKVDPDYAATVLAAKEEVNERLKLDGKNVLVLKKGSKDLHIVPTDKKEALDVLAEELTEGLEAKWFTSKVNRGSATNGSTGGGAAGGERFDAIRKQQEDRQKERQESKKVGTGLERLGRRA